MTAKIDFVEVLIKSRRLFRGDRDRQTLTTVFCHIYFLEAVDKWFGNELIFTPCKTHEFHF